MSDFDLQHPKTDEQIVAQERGWQTAIIARLKDAEKRLAALESAKQK
jgi:hypothetical protein